MVDDLFDRLKALEVKDLSVVRKFLGIRVAFESDGYTLVEETCIREFREAHGMTNANPVTTPNVLH